MELVTREEFDVQAAVLERTREKLETMEARLAELEKSLGERTLS
jgi:BMFP domain-containing protein YqiC